MSKLKELLDDLETISIYWTRSKCEKERMYYQNKFKKLDNKLIKQETKKYAKHK
tara:strand:+ start:125 stop:286 length:162 start_codon:yes stop_codon:yes gene_type:complete